MLKTRRLRPCLKTTLAHVIAFQAKSEQARGPIASAFLATRNYLLSRTHVRTTRRATVFHVGRVGLGLTATKGRRFLPWELLGASVAPHAVIAAVIAYLMSGHLGVYPPGASVGRSRENGSRGATGKLRLRSGAHRFAAAAVPATAVTAC